MQIEVSMKTDRFWVVLLHIMWWVNRKECTPVKGRPVNSRSGSEYSYNAQRRKQETSVKMGNGCGLNDCNSSSYLEVGMEWPSSAAWHLLSFHALIILPFLKGGALPSREAFRLELLPLSMLRDCVFKELFVFLCLSVKSSLALPLLLVPSSCPLFLS